MHVRLLVGRAGPGLVQNRGDVIEVDNAEGHRLIIAGQAELVRDAPVETATAGAPRERAEKPAARKVSSKADRKAGAGK